MGSRRGRHAALAALALASCTAGAPTGFSGGDHWSVPLIGPLEDGLLLVPVFVNGAGPYVFAIDPDANVTIVDEHVVKQAHLRVGEGPHMIDESDTTHPHFYAELLGVEIGTLTVDKKSGLVVKDGTYNADGRVIDGVLGRDVIADSLVFGFDRDQGLVTLATHKAGRSPAGPGPLMFVKYESVPSTLQAIEVPPPPRRLVKARINGQGYSMHVDLGAKLSQLRERAWGNAGLAATDAHLVTVDETGLARQVTKAGNGNVEIVRTRDSTLIKGSSEINATTTNVTFVPYADDRWPDQDVDGALGLDFFRPFSVTVDWGEHALYIKDRHEVPVATRIGRWQSKTLSSCKSLGCATVSLIDPLANVPPEQRPAQHPGVVASVVRSPEAAGLLLEVTIAAISAQGTPLPWLVANLQGTADRAMTHLSAAYVGATLAVVDASEFPRDCPNGNSCIDLLAPPGH